MKPPLWQTVLVIVLGVLVGVMAVYVFIQRDQSAVRIEIPDKDRMILGIIETRDAAMEHARKDYSDTVKSLSTNFKSTMEKK